MGPTDESPGRLLERARGGDDRALGALLELYRNYLRLLARGLIRGALRVRVDPSDLVQETFLKAHRNFSDFAGAGEPELVAWLRKILVRNLADDVKHHQAQARDHRRQGSLEAMLDQSGLAIEHALADTSASPSRHAEHREQAVLIADAVARLPADYREVFILRNVEHVPLDQVAAQLGRSEDAVRKLWTRALLSLRRTLGGDSP